MADKIQLRRDTAANWTTADSLLAQGELGYEIDTCRLKIGDGTTTWNSLDYKFESSVVESPAGTFTFTDELGNTTVWTISSGVTDHGALTGLGDDDHTQYHDDVRGDARYYTQTQIDAQQLIQDNAITLNTAKVSFPEAPTDGQDYVRNNGSWVVDSGGGVTDHGALTGLSDDDHTQYLTEARHDSLPSDNPHSVTFTQSVTADGTTDVTSSEIEELTDGSETTLHTHPLPFHASQKKVSDAAGSVGINDTTTDAIYTTLTFTAPETGNYDIDWFYIWSLNDGAQDFIGDIKIDGVYLTNNIMHRQEPKDVAGTGVVLSNTTGGTTNSSTDQRHQVTGFEPARNFTAGIHTIELEWSCSAAGDRATIYQAALRVRRVS